MQFSMIVQSVPIVTFSSITAPDLITHPAPIETPFGEIVASSAITAVSSMNVSEHSRLL